MYYSRITLDLAKLPPGRLKELITKGSYALHQWVSEILRFSVI